MDFLESALILIPSLTGMLIDILSTDGLLNQIKGAGTI